MQTLAQFIQEHGDLSEDRFRERFDHAFLLITAAAVTREKGSKDFHTKLATDVKESLTASLREAMVVPLVKRREGPATGRVTVGRAPNNDVVLDGDAISKLHAYFKVNRQGSYSLCDAGSTNGTTLDGTVLRTNEPALLNGGETVIFGNRWEGTFHTPESLHRHLGFLKRWLR